MSVVEAMAAAAARFFVTDLVEKTIRKTLPDLLLFSNVKHGDRVVVDVHDPPSK